MRTFVVSLAVIAAALQATATKTYVYDGDLVLNNVEDVAAATALVGDADTFTVAGNLKINAPTLGNAELSPLASKITAVRGSAMIANTKTFTCLASVFPNLAEVGYSMTLRWNEGLVSVCGLKDLTVGGTVSILSDSAPMRIPESLKSASGKKHGDFLACDAPKGVVAPPAAPKEAVVHRVVRDAASTEWMEMEGGNWTDMTKWTDAVPCGGRTAVFPEFESNGAPQTYVIALSAETHPVGALSMAPGSKIELQRSTVLDFGAGKDAACPKVDTTTTITTTTTIFNAANVDCVETVSPCTAVCEAAADRTVQVSVQPVAAGRACVGATDCDVGDGLCAAGGKTVKVSAMVPGEAAAAIVAALEAMMSSSTVSLNLVLNGEPVTLSGAAKVGDDLVLSFSNLVFADLTEANKQSLMEQVLVNAGSLFGFTGGNAEVKENTAGNTDVVLTFDDPKDNLESGDGEGGGFPVGAIAGGAGALVLIIVIVVVVMKSGNNDGLPTSMADSGITSFGDDNRAVQNPLYEQPAGAEGTDGYMEVTN